MADIEAAFEAIKEGDDARLAELLDADASLADARNEGGVSLLMFACYCRREPMAELIRRRRSDALDVYEAAALGDVDRLGALIDCDASLVSSAAPDGFSPLHLAAFFGRPDAVAALLARGADGDCETANPMKLRPIHSAAAAGCLKSVNRLIRHGVDVNAAQHGGWTALHSAAHHGRVDLLEALLVAGADTTVRSDDGRTPRDMAAEDGHTQIVEMLDRAAG